MLQLCVYRVMVARGKLELRFSRALQTSSVHPELDIRTLSMNQFFHILRLNTGRRSGLWESQLRSKTIRESTPFFVFVLHFVLSNNFGWLVLARFIEINEIIFNAIFSWFSFKPLLSASDVQLRKYTFPKQEWTTERTWYCHLTDWLSFVNPLTPKISSEIPHTLFHSILMMLLWRIWHWIK